MRSNRLVFVLISPFLMPALLRQPVLASNEGDVVQDSVVVKKVLKAVRSHVLSVTRDRKKPLIVREGKKSRRFIVINFFGSVTRNKNLYTAQVDVDEYDHKIPRILYVDVKAVKGVYKVTKIRIGPNHFRENDKTSGLEE